MSVKEYCAQLPATDVNLSELAVSTGGSPSRFSPKATASGLSVTRMTALIISALLVPCEDPRLYMPHGTPESNAITCARAMSST